MIAIGRVARRLGVRARDTHAKRLRRAGTVGVRQRSRPRAFGRACPSARAASRSARASQRVSDKKKTQKLGKKPSGAVPKKVNSPFASQTASPASWRVLLWPGKSAHNRNGFGKSAHNRRKNTEPRSCAHLVAGQLVDRAPARLRARLAERAHLRVGKGVRARHRAVHEVVHARGRRLGRARGDPDRLAEPEKTRPAGGRARLLGERVRARNRGALAFGFAAALAHRRARGGLGGRALRPDEPTRDRGEVRARRGGRAVHRVRVRVRAEPRVQLGDGDARPPAGAASLFVSRKGKIVSRLKPKIARPKPKPPSGVFFLVSTVAKSQQ